MKNLFQFLAEAGASQASAQAAKLNLKSDGHGSWIDSRGNIVATTEKGRLVFLDKKKKRAEEGPVQQMAKRRADDDLAGAPLQRKEAPKPKKVTPDDEEGAKSTEEPLTVAFGRFNPPTVGHGKLLGAAKKAAAGGDLKIYPSRTQDNNKNPIDPDMKVSYMRKMFPDFEENIVNDPEMRSIFNVLTTASEEGYKSINIVVGADRLGEFENLAMKYNGDLYDFEEIRTISAGPREDDAEGIEGVSSSKQRKAVMDDDYRAFKKGLPKSVDDADGQALFDAVRVGMNKKKKDDKKVEEEIDLWMVAPKLDPRGLRENYVKKRIFRLGDLVESLNTGLVGRIMRRGTNYLICVTEQDNMFKSWIHDVMEAVKPAHKTKRYGVPANERELGTDAYLQYAQSMVPGQEKIRNFINRYKAKK